MIVSEWVLKGKRKIQAVSLTYEGERRSHILPHRNSCGPGRRQNTRPADHCAHVELADSKPSNTNFPKENLMSSTVQGTNPLSLSFKPTLLYSALRSGTLQPFLLCQLWGFQRETGWRKRSLFSACCQSQGTSPWQFEWFQFLAFIQPSSIPQIASLHSRDAIGNWPGPSQATSRDLNPSLQGPPVSV